MYVWLASIVRVAVRVLKGTGAADVRSDDEEGEEDEESGDVSVEAVEITPDPAAQKLRFRFQPGRMSAHRRKELLSRVGCENKID